MKAKRTASIITALVVVFLFTLSAAPAARGATTTSWQLMPGRAIDIGVGAKGHVWVIARNGTPHKWTGSSWQHIPGLSGGQRIDVDINGNAWVAQDAAHGNAVYHWTGSQWQVMPGGGIDIGVGAKGQVWLIARNGTPHR